MKLTRGKPLQHAVEPLEVLVVLPVLEVEQDRHPVLRRQAGQSRHIVRVAVDKELLLPDPDRTSLEVLLDRRQRLWQRGVLVGKEDELPGMALGHRHHRVVAVTVRLQPIPRSGRQQHRLRHPEHPLVAHQIFVTPPPVMGMLVDVDDLLPGFEQTPDCRHAAHCQKSPSLHRLPPRSQYLTVSRYFLPAGTLISGSGDSSSMMYQAMPILRAAWSTATRST